MKIFSPHKVRLNIEKVEKLEFWHFEFFQVFQCLVYSEVKNIILIICKSSLCKVRLNPREITLQDMMSSQCDLDYCLLDICFCNVLFFWIIRTNDIHLHFLNRITTTGRKEWSYLASRGPWWLLRNIYIKTQSIPSPGKCLLRSDHRGPRLNKYNQYFLSFNFANLYFNQ